jgi:hypothetical protein
MTQKTDEDRLILGEVTETKDVDHYVVQVVEGIR